jgi:DNA helicase-2/ATP-dependent DNA helicase PcrA
LAEEVLNESGYLRWLQGQDTVEADSRIENLREVLSSISDYEEEMSYAGDDPSLADYLTRISLVADADTLQDVPRVPMMTVHAAKGLEFDAVFLTGMEERLFPLRGQEPGEEEELEEERRLAYVAITRARHWLHVSHANTRMIYGQVRYNQPSRFLGDLPPANQQRVATDALEQLAKSFTSRADQPSWRELIRARTGVTPERRPAAPRPAAPPAGERFIDRDEDAFIDDVFEDVDLDVDPSELRVGSRVRHSKFGLGKVQAIDRGFDPAVTVHFEAWGIKRIKLRFLTPA